METVELQAGLYRAKSGVPVEIIHLELKGK
jgi:hypothetical protein